MIQPFVSVVRDSGRPIAERRIALEGIRNEAKTDDDRVLLASLQNEFSELRAPEDDGEDASAANTSTANAEADTLSADARAMLASLGLKPLALFAVSDEQFEKYCRKHGITGERYDALHDEWQDYCLPSDELLRLLYLADSGADIHWGWLAHWRNVLANTKKRLVKQFAEYSIGMLAKYEKVPGDVRKAATKFLGDYSQAGEGQPVPKISLPGKERWPEMPRGVLYGRMVRLRELQAAA